MTYEKRFEISCSSADQNRCFCIYWSLIKAINRIQFSSSEKGAYYTRWGLYSELLFPFKAMIWARS